MQHKDIIIIKKVISEMQMALDLLGNANLQQFKENEMQKRAVCMTVVNIGELIKGF